MMIDPIRSTCSPHWLVTVTQPRKSQRMLSLRRHDRRRLELQMTIPPTIDGIRCNRGGDESCETSLPNS